MAWNFLGLGLIASRHEMRTSTKAALGSRSDILVWFFDRAVRDNLDSIIIADREANGDARSTGRSVPISKSMDVDVTRPLCEAKD
jgi:hypothetical protein